MDHYKLLNKELITEVQTLKQMNRMYEKLITESKGDLMRERSLRVQQQQRFLTLVKKNFSEMVQVLNPETNLHDLLSSDKENDSPRPQSTERRSSNKIMENFTQSLQAVQRSVVSLSPIPKRRTTLSKSVSEDSSVYEVDSEVGEDDTNNSCKENENDAQKLTIPAQMVEEEIKEVTNGAERLSLLAEETEDEEEEEEEEVEENETSTLRYNTKKCLTTTISNSRTEEMILRNSASIQSESIVQVSLPLSFPAPNNSRLLCSTPREFIDDSTYTQLCGTAHNEATTPQTSTRPKRKCAPRNLKERSLQEKLRNDRSVKKTEKKSGKKTIKR